MNYSTQMARIVSLLGYYLAQRGLLARVARKLGHDPSYVSRVANGVRANKRISQAIEAELNKMHLVSLKIGHSSGKGSASPAPKRRARTPP
jgi:hypothetical protein